MSEEPLSANVRKKGRPPILDAQADAIFKLQFPDKSRRGRYGMMRFAQVAEVLITFAGEDPLRALGAIQSRPKTLARFPWLLGKPVQHVVLSEMNGLADAEIIAAAAYVEKERHEKRINAKQARQIVRGVKMLFRAERTR